MNLLQSLQQRGQSVWLDGFERGWITSGQLQHDVEEDGVRGVALNFQSLQAAIQGQEYDRDFSTLARQGSKLSARQYYDYVVMRDLQLAADLLKQTYTQTHGRDGYVQVDLPPYSLLQAETAIAAAQSLWRRVGWRNLMVSLPATPTMLPVITQLISDRINVNATFVLSQTTYEQVFNAYLQGLESFIQQKASVSDIVCFTSFPIGRLDAAIHPLLPNSLEMPSCGIVQANLLHQYYLNIYQSDRWKTLCKQVHPLRLVWNCTGMQLQDTWCSVQALAALETAVVLAPSVLETYSEVSLLPAKLVNNVEEAEQMMASFLEKDIALDQITDQLVSEEIARSMKDFDQLLNTIEQKRSNLNTQP
jgi:transaldolase